MVTSLLLTPLATLADPEIWTLTNPVPLLWALTLIFLSLGLRGATPGKRWMKLDVTGAGCLICREIRRMSWALVLGLDALMHGFLTPQISTALLALGLGLLGWLIVWPILTRAADFPHNDATQISVARRA